MPGLPDASVGDLAGMTDEDLLTVNTPRTGGRVRLIMQSVPVFRHLDMADVRLLPFPLSTVLDPVYATQKSASTPLHEGGTLVS